MPICEITIWALQIKNIRNWYNAIWQCDKTVCCNNNLYCLFRK